MKNYTKYGVGIASLCLSLMLVNCGGGSSSSGGENSSSDGSTKGELTNKSVESFAASISEELGCTYTSEGNVQAAVNKNGFLAVGRAGAVVFSNTKRTGTTLQRATPRECSSPMAGGCGGSATICSSGESLIADFSDYCTQDYGGVSTTLDGKITIGIAQSDDGSATYTASTQSPLSIKTVNPNTEENVDVTLSLSNGKAVKAPTECGMHVTASSISVTDNIAKENYSAKNVDIIVDDNCNVSIEADYTDSKMGSLHISGTSDANGNTALTLTDSKGSTATFSASSGNNVFTISTNNSETGTMDCSAVDTSVLNGLVPME